MIESEKLLPRSAKKVSSKLKLLPKFQLGQKGEALAVDFLRQKGFQIVETNYTYGAHEIDIIAVDSATHELVFVEVKTLSSRFYGDPSQAVNFRKMRALRQSAALYRQEKCLSQDFRFDVIAIAGSEVNHYENISW